MILQIIVKTGNTAAKYPLYDKIIKFSHILGTIYSLYFLIFTKKTTYCTFSN